MTDPKPEWDREPEGEQTSIWESQTFQWIIAIPLGILMATVGLPVLAVALVAYGGFLFLAWGLGRRRPR